jgi:hypothetical protein
LHGLLQVLLGRRRRGRLARVPALLLRLRVGGGLILARSGSDWNVLLYLMVGASLAAAACWLFLDPEKRT